MNSTCEDQALLAGEVELTDEQLAAVYGAGEGGYQPYGGYGPAYGYQPYGGYGPAYVVCYKKHVKYEKYVRFEYDVEIKKDKYWY